MVDNQPPQPTLQAIADSLATLQNNFDRQTIHHNQQLQTITQNFQQLHVTIEELKGGNSGSTSQHRQAQGILGPGPRHERTGSFGDDSSLSRTFNVKLDLPRFDSSDPHGWIFRAEEYFDFHEMPDDQRVRIVSFTMEDKASEWYQYMKRNRLLGSWQEFQDSLVLRFRPSKFEDYQGKLAKLTQKTLVADYQTEFEFLMNKVIGVTESWLISIWIAGLKPLLRREVGMAKPVSLWRRLHLHENLKLNMRTFKQSFTLNGVLLLCHVGRINMESIKLGVKQLMV